MTPIEETPPQANRPAEQRIHPSSSEHPGIASSFKALASSRIALLTAEARIAVESTVKKLILAAIAAITALLFWIILMAGLIGLIPTLVCSLFWYHIALIIAGLHLTIFIIAILLLKKKNPPPFSLTRTEFEKDRQWLSKTPQNPTSPS